MTGQGLGSKLHNLNSENVPMTVHYDNLFGEVMKPLICITFGTMLWMILFFSFLGELKMFIVICIRFARLGGVHNKSAPGEPGQLKPEDNHNFSVACQVQSVTFFFFYWTKRWG